ncbi:MAG TPA: hypothetical protein VFU35_06265, partial [Jatrophihabitans sp.]|nr:hypothetical protein [Jatrophihabitans sp.]
PSLDVVVSAPVDTGQRFPVGPPVTELPTISTGGTGDWPPRERRQQHVPPPPGERPQPPAKRPAMRRQRRGKSA